MARNIKWNRKLENDMESGIFMIDRDSFSNILQSNSGISNSDHTSEPVIARVVPAKLEIATPEHHRTRATGSCSTTLRPGNGNA